VEEVERDGPSHPGDGLTAVQVGTRVERVCPSSIEFFVLYCPRICNKVAHAVAAIGLVVSVLKVPTFFLLRGYAGCA
jgi:hypothetical protein